MFQYKERGKQCDTVTVTPFVMLWLQAQLSTAEILDVPSLSTQQELDQHPGRKQSL
jgi:hypothetical protein